MHTIEIEGVRYVKAIDVAKHIGYTTDYVGQLARAGKIDARQVGRAWYIREHELEEHKKGHIRSNMEKTRDGVRKTLSSPSSHEIHNVFYVPPPVQISEFRKRLLDTSVRYETDSRPLAPEMHQRVHVDENTRHSAPQSTDTLALEVEDIDDLSEGSSRVLPIDEKTKDAVLIAERPEEPTTHGGVDVMDMNEYPSEEKDTSTDFEGRIDPGEDVTMIHSASSHNHHYFHHSAPSAGIPLQSPREYSPRADVPVIALGRRRPMALMNPFVMALVPLLIFVLFAFSVSGLFLQRVLVYQQGETMTAAPYYQAYYDLVKLDVITELIPH